MYLHTCVYDEWLEKNVVLTFIGNTDFTSEIQGLIAHGERCFHCESLARAKRYFFIPKLGTIFKIAFFFYFV